MTVPWWGMGLLALLPTLIHRDVRHELLPVTLFQVEAPQVVPWVVVGAAKEVQEAPLLQDREP